MCSGSVFVGPRRADATTFAEANAAVLDLSLESCSAIRTGLAHRSAARWAEAFGNVAKSLCV